jgi:hypothetical protein
MGAVSDPRRHHIVPIKAHLTHFANDKEQLGAIDTQTGRSWVSHVRNLAVEGDFFRLPDGVGADPFAAEKDLERFEDAARPVFARLALVADEIAHACREADARQVPRPALNAYTGCFRIESVEREAVALYIALQGARTRAARGRYGAAIEAGQLDDGSLFAPADESETAARSAQILSMFNNRGLSNLSHIIGHLSWFFLMDPYGAITTSDEPLQLETPLECIDEHGHAIHGMNGALPLSRYSVLELSSAHTEDSLAAIPPTSEWQEWKRAIARDQWSVGTQLYKHPEDLDEVLSWFG